MSRVLERWPRIVIGTMLVVAYAATAPTGVLGGDNPEFSTLFAVGGVAHPSGYPLYVVWLRAMSLVLHTASPAHGAALANVPIGLAVAVLIGSLCRRLGASEAASALAMGLYAFSGIAWEYGAQSEVFALNTALVLGIALAAAPGGTLAGPKRMALLGLLGGLALSNHMTSVFSLPLGMYGIVLAFRERARDGGRAWVTAGAGALAFVVGLLPYAQLPLATHFAHAQGVSWVWGEPSTVTRFMNHVLRRSYGTFSLAAGSTNATPWSELRYLGEVWLREMRWIPLVAVVAGVFAAFRRRLRRTETNEPTTRTRPYWACLALAFLVAGPLFVMRFNLPPEGTLRHVVWRFHILPIALSMPFVAVGADALGALLLRATSAARDSRRVARMAELGAVVVAGVALAGSIGSVREAFRPSVDTYLRNTFAMLPPRAIVLVTSDHVAGGSLYVQRALGLRNDVLVIAPPLTSAKWYRDSVERDLGPSLKPAWIPGYNIITTLHAIEKTDRPVFVSGGGKALVEMGSEFASYPVGTLIRVVFRGENSPSPLELERMNAEVLEHFDFDGDPPTDSTSWTARVYEDYARPWFVLARTYEAQGDAIRAERNRARGHTLAPWINGNATPAH